MTTTMKVRAAHAVVASVMLVAVSLAGAPARGATLDFESDDATRHFVFDEMGRYQPNPYDVPDDGADRLAQATASEWVGMKSGESDVASLRWDGGLQGGANSVFNLLLPDSFDLISFVIAGVYGSQTLAVQGLNDGQLRYSAWADIDLTPQLFQAGWAAIDEVRFISGTNFVVHPDHASAGVRRNWAIDNLMYTDTTAAPLPPAGLLFVSAALPFLVSVRSRFLRPGCGR